MASSTGSNAAEQSAQTVPLSELVGDQAGFSNSWSLVVYKTRVAEYTYQWEGKQVNARKFEAILLSSDASQYCLGVVKQTKKGGPQEIDALKARFSEKTVWKFSKVKLVQEKQSYVHTSCRIVIDLRKTTSQALLQSPEYPRGPIPPTTVAQVTELRSMQRFDLIGVVAEITSERHSSVGPVMEIRVLDGSKTENGTIAAIMFPLFFRTSSDADNFKGNVGNTPVLFCGLQGKPEAGNVNVATVKDVFFWEKAPWSPLATRVKEIVGESIDNGFSVIAAPPKFEPTERVDYINVPATFTVCGMLDKPDCLLGPDDEELLYQVNYVAVRAPTPSDSIHTEVGGRLWSFTRLWDCTGTVELPFRGQAMLALAGLGENDAEIYSARHAAGELSYPLLVSLRVRVRRPKGELSRLGLTVMAAEPQDLILKPTKAFADITTLAECMPPRTDRLAVVKLKDLRPSTFYNMVMGTTAEPTDKAMVIVQSNQKSICKNTGAGFRVQTDLVSDAMAEVGDADKYRLIANCTVEEFSRYQFPPASSAQKPSYAIAIVSKVVNPTQQFHKADLVVEAMEVLNESDVPQIISTFKRMSRATACVTRKSGAEDSLPTTPIQAWKQRSCKKLKVCPTDASLEE